MCVLIETRIVNKLKPSPERLHRNHYDITSSSFLFKIGIMSYISNWNHYSNENLINLGYILQNLMNCKWIGGYFLEEWIQMFGEWIHCYFWYDEKLCLIWLKEEETEMTAKTVITFFVCQYLCKLVNWLILIFVFGTVVT